MTHPPSPAATPLSDPRPVLFWRPDSDESRVEANLETAAAFLGVETNTVVDAIASGDLLDGWFVDWDAGGAA